MDGQYLSFVSNDIANEDGTLSEVLRVFPESLRRIFEPIHSPSNNTQQWSLKYSQTDVLVRIRTKDGPLVHLEALDFVIDMSSVHIVTKPADVVFDTADILEDEFDVDWDKIKKIIWGLFPEILLSNFFENKSIVSSPPQQGATTRILQTPRLRYPPDVPLVDAERVG